MSGFSLVTSRWWRVLPLVFITYSLSYLDRANYGIAAAAGMATDLHLTRQMSALIGALFALGYCVFQVPGAIYAQRQSVRKLVFLCLLLWGSFAALTGVVRNAPGLLLLRFGLGVAEAAVLPAMLIYVSNWFTSAERSRANSLLILGGPMTLLWMSISSGYLVQAVGWRWMFLLEGLPSVVWSFFWWRLSDAHPSEALWLNNQERSQLAEKLTKKKANLTSVSNYRKALSSRPVILLSCQYFFWNMSLFGFVLWLPALLNNSSASGIVQTGWLSAA